MSRMRLGRFVITAPRVEKSTFSRFRFDSALPTLACWEAWSLCRLSVLDAFQTVGAEIAANMTTIATSASERADVVWRLRMPAWRTIAAPAAIRNQPAYGRVATAIRQPRMMGPREWRSPRFQIVAPPKATRPPASIMFGSLWRSVEKNTPVGSRASNQAVIRAGL